MPNPTIMHMEKTVETAIKLFDRNVPIDKFPEELKHRFEMWQVAHQLKLKYQHKGEEFVRELFKIRFNDISDSTARLEIRSAEIFFGKTQQSNRNYERILRIEFLKKASYKAFAEGKLKEMASIEGILQKYLDPAHDPIDMPDWEELRRSVQVNITFSPEIVGAERLPDDEVRRLWTAVQSKRNLNIQDAEIVKEDE
jgi:hypothetical protein